MSVRCVTVTGYGLSLAAGRDAQLEADAIADAIAKVLRDRGYAQHRVYAQLTSDRGTGERTVNTYPPPREAGSSVTRAEPARFESAGGTTRSLASQQRERAVVDGRPGCARTEGAA